LEERISDTAIHNRLKACVPWVKAVPTGMMGEAVKPLREGRLRILVVDGSSVQDPGATETWYRLHIAMDRVRLHISPGVVTDEHAAEARRRRRKKVARSNNARCGSPSGC